MKYMSGHMPYVGITASEMIVKKKIEFFDRNGELFKFNGHGELEPASGYEKGLYDQMLQEINHVQS
jgi:hypothetical protein